MIWRVGNGERIRTWRDPWIPKGPVFKPVTPKRNCRLNFVADFLNEHGAWNTQLLREHFWPMDVDEILKIRTSPRQRQDFISWQPERSGRFSVRSAYRLATSSHNDAFAGGASSDSPDGNRSLWKLIWRAHIPQKIKIVAWKASVGALATMLGKVEHHIGVRAICPICGVEEETSFHALVTCGHARVLWDRMREVWPLPPSERLQHTGKDWLLLVLAGCSADSRSMIILLIWRIWQMRNDIFHGNDATPTSISFEFL